MFISAYHFDGDAADLVRAYDRMRQHLPADALEFHACVVTGRGITVLDGCPSRQQFEAFSSSAEFRAVLAAAGLPAPRIEPLGAAHCVVARIALAGEGAAR
jgi:hypothetical protein